MTARTLILAGRWWWAAHLARRATARAVARAWRDGADIDALMAAATAELPHLPPWRTAPPRDSAPACHDGRARCRECREGGDCRDAETGPTAYSAARLSLPVAGRHDQHRQAAAWCRRDRLNRLRDMCELAPRAMAELLGRPVRIGAAAGLPLARLP